MSSTTLLLHPSGRGNNQDRQDDNLDDRITPSKENILGESGNEVAAKAKEALNSLEVIDNEEVNYFVSDH